MAVLGVTGSVSALGWLAGRDKGDEAWGVPLCFAVMTLWAAACASLAMYLRARWITPRRIEVQGSDLVVTMPVRTVKVPIHTCTWAVGPATRDSFLGLFLAARECVVVTTEAGARFALGYNHDRPDEWIDVLIRNSD